MDETKFVYCEYGSRRPITFLKPHQVKMYDEDGKEVFCSCGKPATSALMGKNSYIARCSDCMLGISKPDDRSHQD